MDWLLCKCGIIFIYMKGDGLKIRRLHTLHSNDVDLGRRKSIGVAGWDRSMINSMNTTVS